MEIGGSNAGASTYAMKKAMEMSNLLLNSVQQTADSGNQLHSTKTSKSVKTADLDSVTGKGKIFDIVA